MNTYIEYESEHFHGIVGPFEHRLAADRWAAARQQTAEWQGVQVYTPDAAAAALAGVK